MLIENLSRFSAVLAAIGAVGGANAADACFHLPPGQSLEDLKAQQPAVMQNSPCPVQAPRAEPAADRIQGPRAELAADRIQAPRDELASGRIQARQVPHSERPDPFVFEWHVDGPKTMYLVFPANTHYNLEVDAGNGYGLLLLSNDIHDEYGERDAHVAPLEYDEAGDYEVAIWGQVDAMRFSNDAQACELLQVLDLGDMGWISTKNMFANCHKLTDVLGGKMSQVTDMSGMFYNAEHAAPETDAWDVSQVTSMKRMFQGALEANPDTTSWNMSKVRDLAGMFYQAPLADPDTSNWDLTSLKRDGASGAFASAPAAERAKLNFDERGFKEHRESSYLDLGADRSAPAAPAPQKEPVRAQASTAPLSQGPAPFVFEWQVDDEGDIMHFWLPPNTTYDFVVDWGDGTVNQISSRDATPGMNTGIGGHYDAPGTYRVTISGHVDAMQFSAKGHKCKLLRVLDLGDVGWTSTENMFYTCHNLTTVRGGDMSRVTNMGQMFFGAHNATPETGDWDVSRVTNMAGMFMSATMADPDVADWDVSRVRNLDGMFLRAASASPNTQHWRLPAGASATDIFLHAPHAGDAKKDFARRGYKASQPLYFGDAPPGRAWVKDEMRQYRNEVRDAYESGDFLDYANVPPPRDVVKKWERDARRNHSRQ